MQNLFLAFISITILGKLYLKTGKLTQAINICQKALDLDAQQGYKVSYSGLIYLLMGELCFLQADLDSAERYLLHGIDLVEKHEDVYSVIHGYFNLARVHLSRGEAEVAQEFMNRMVSLISDLSPSKNALRYSSVCQAYIWLYAGSLKSARKWMRSADHNQLDRSHPYDVSSDYAYRGIYLAPQDMVSESLEFIRLTEARLMIGVGDPDAALAILDQILDQPDNLERIYYRIQALILRSLAMMALAHPEKAAIDLQAAIRIAAPEGLIQLFVLEGEALYPVLDRVAEKFVETNKYSSEEIVNFQFVERLFYRLASFESAKKRKVSFDLTPREIQVIKLLSKGLSYKETAKRAIISENTFRTHVKRIYRKLGVNNRLQAVNKAKKFGLLE